MYLNWLKASEMITFFRKCYKDCKDLLILLVESGRHQESLLLQLQHKDSVQPCCVILTDQHEHLYCVCLSVPLMGAPQFSFRHHLFPLNKVGEKLKNTHSAGMRQTDASVTTTTGSMPVTFPCPVPRTKTRHRDLPIGLEERLCQKTKTDRADICRLLLGCGTSPVHFALGDHGEKGSYLSSLKDSCCGI